MIIGQRKSGTSSLHHHISMHDQIVFSHNETHWFTQNIFKNWTHRNKGVNFDPYFQYFDVLATQLENCRDSSCQNLIIGDSSPSYLWCHGHLEFNLRKFQFKENSFSIPQIVYDTIPSVKLIVILRNPVDRYLTMKHTLSIILKLNKLKDLFRI